MEPKCPDAPHAHLFEMPCWTCFVPVKVANICNSAAWSDPASPDRIAGFEEKAKAWIRSQGLLTARSPNGGLGIACPSCGALQGEFFIMEAFLDIVHETWTYETVEILMGANPQRA